MLSNRFGTVNNFHQGFEPALSFIKPYTYLTFIKEVKENEMHLLSLPRPLPKPLATRKYRLSKNLFVRACVRVRVARPDRKVCFYAFFEKKDLSTASLKWRLDGLCLIGHFYVFHDPSKLCKYMPNGNQYANWSVLLNRAVCNSYYNKNSVKRYLYGRGRLTRSQLIGNTEKHFPSKHTIVTYTCTHVYMVHILYICTQRFQPNRFKAAVLKMLKTYKRKKIKVNTGQVMFSGEIYYY